MARALYATVDEHVGALPEDVAAQKAEVRRLVLLLLVDQRRAGQP